MMKRASFHVRATEKQSVRWHRAAEAENHRSVGTWLAEAADRYLDALQRAGKPLPLAWGRGRFRVRLEDGSEPEVRGWIARPFGLYHGTQAGPLPHGAHQAERSGGRRENGFTWMHRGIRMTPGDGGRDRPQALV